MAVDREQIFAIRSIEVRTTMAPSRSPASDDGSAVFGTRTDSVGLFAVRRCTASGHQRGAQINDTVAVAFVDLESLRKGYVDRIGIRRWPVVRTTTGIA